MVSSCAKGKHDVFSYSGQPCRLYAVVQSLRTCIWNAAVIAALSTFFKSLGLH